MREVGVKMRPPSMVRSSIGVQPMTRSCTKAGLVFPLRAVKAPLAFRLPMFELSNWIRKLNTLYAVPEACRRARRRKKSLSSDFSADPSKVPSYRACKRTLTLRLMSSLPVGTLTADAEEDTSRAARPRGNATHLSPSRPCLQHDGVNSVLRIRESGVCEAHQTGAASVASSQSAQTKANRSALTLDLASALISGPRRSCRTAPPCSQLAFPKRRRSSWVRGSPGAR